MKQRLFTILPVIVALLCQSCGKEVVYNYTDVNAPAPAQVTNIKVIPTPGGGTLTYSLPIDPNLAYVKAVYQLKPGQTAEAKSSVFKDSIFIFGFGDVAPRDVKLYSIGKNEKASDPVSVSLIPLKPPVASVFGSLVVSPTFGGVNVKFQNPSKANLAIALIYDSSGNGDWKETKTLYTAQTEGAFSARGFDTASKRFAVFIRDRWNNKSDTLRKIIKPIFEEHISKKSWKPVYLPNDTYQYVESYDLTRLYDSSWGWNYNIFASKHTAALPQWFTIDLGKKVLLSRMKQMHYHEAPYSGPSVKSFEIWGSNEPAADGSWESWTKLSSFESFKPSGLPLGQNTGEDVNYGVMLGEDFDFPPDLPTYRYIRFKTLATFASAGPTGQVTINEISFWGKVMP